MACQGAVTRVMCHILHQLEGASCCYLAQQAKKPKSDWSILNGIHRGFVQSLQPSMHQMFSVGSLTDGYLKQIQLIREMFHEVCQVLKYSELI